MLTSDLVQPLVRLSSALVVAAFGAGCAEPARVDGRTLDEQLERIATARGVLRAPLVRQIGAFGDAAESAVPRLVEWLRADPDLRDAAAAALCAIGTEPARGALLDVAADVDADADAVDAAAGAAAGCVPAERLADVLRDLVGREPARAARLLASDRFYAAALANADVREEVVHALTDRIDALDPRGRDTVLRRLAALGAGAAGRENVLAQALERRTAVDAVLDALVATGSRRALEILVARAQAPWTIGSRAELLAIGRLGHVDPEIALAALDRVPPDADPEVRKARLTALAELLRAVPGPREAIVTALTRAVDEPRSAVEGHALEVWKQLVADGAVTPDTALRAWSEVARTTEHPDRGRRIVAAIAASGFPPADAITALREIGASAPPTVAAAAVPALATYQAATAHAARFDVLLRTDPRDAVAHATAWAQDERTTTGVLAAAIARAARRTPPPSFLNALLAALDAAPAERNRVLAELFAADDVEVDVRLEAARRLRLHAPASLLLPARVGDAVVRLRVLADRTTRQVAPADVDAAHGAIYVLPRPGRLELDGARLDATRTVVLLDAALRETERRPLAPGGEVSAEGIGALVLLPATAAADAALAGLDPALIRGLAR